MKRIPHKLNTCKGSDRPRWCVFFDSESDVVEGKHYPYLIEACFKDYITGKEEWEEYEAPGHVEGSNEYQLGSIPDFWSDVVNFGSREKCVIHVYAHNAGYDVIATHAIPLLVRHKFKVDSYFEKGSVFILSLVKTKLTYNKKKRIDEEKPIKKIVIISTTNYFAAKLADLGDIFGVPKLDFAEARNDREKAKPYCKRDVEICKTAFENFMDFVEREELGVMAKTVAGQSFNAFRHRFMEEDRIYIHAHPGAMELEREAYSGGRVECRRLGVQEESDFFYYFDVNSMYPHVMRSQKYPVKLLSYKKHNSLATVRNILADGKGIVGRFKVKTDKPYYGVKIAGKLIFPVGEFWCYLSTPEIEHALANNLIEAVGELAVYEMDYVFVDYVNYFYEKRLAAKASKDKIHDFLYKLFMNSLYGKFGQRSEDFKRVGDYNPNVVKTVDIYRISDQSRHTLKIFGGSIFEKQGEGDGFNSFVAIAAHVTAHARMLLTSYIERAGWDNYYYCDTDSIFTNEEGRQKLLDELDNKELGKLKLERKSRRLRINAPKDYSFGSFRKLKGISKNGSRQIDNTKYMTQQWPKLNSMIQKGRLGEYENRDIIKEMSRKYNKGWVTVSGKVLPLQFTISGMHNTFVQWQHTWYFKNGEILKNNEQRGELNKIYANEK